MGLVLNGGVELFRLHETRLLIEIGCLVPFFNVEEGEYNEKKESYALTGYGALVLMW